METLIVILSAIGFFSLLGWLIQQVITSKAKERALEQENSKLKKDYSALQEEIVNLKNETAKYTHRDIILSKYNFIDRFGIHKLKTSNNAYFCHKCLKEEPPRESQLKVEPNGWQCNYCGKFYDNPDFRIDIPRNDSSY